MSLSAEEVNKLTGLNRTAIRRAEQRGEFPKRIQISPRSVGWKKREIIAWQEIPRATKRNY